MNKAYRFIFGAMAIFSFGCASPNYDGVDLLTFLPGGSTYKHVAKKRAENVKSQVSTMRESYDYAEYFPSEQKIRVASNGETTMVTVDPIGVFEAVQKDGGWWAVLFDVGKGVGYYFLADEMLSSGSSSDSETPRSRPGTSADNNTTGRDSTTLQISGDGNTINVDQSTKSVAL
jgi:hypothetical protein